MLKNHGFNVAYGTYYLGIALYIIIIQCYYTHMCNKDTAITSTYRIDHRSQSSCIGYVFQSRTVHPSDTIVKLHMTTLGTTEFDNLRNVGFKLG